MIYYKIRRKADGKFARNGTSCLYGGYGRKSKDGLPSGWGVGQAYSERAFTDVRRLYNSLGCGHHEWKNNTSIHYPNKPGTSGLLYKDIELVKFGPGGEIVCWTDTKCTLTPEEARKLEPTGKAEPTLLARQAGIRDEIGPLLDKIDDVETALDAGKTVELDNLYSEIDLKKFKLQAALDELVLRDGQLKSKVKNILLGD